MPKNLALTIGGDGGLASSVNALVPLLMNKLQQENGAKPTEGGSPSSPADGNGSGHLNAPPEMRSSYTMTLKGGTLMPAEGRN